MFFERSSWQGIDLISSTAKDVSTDKVGCKVHAPQLKSYAQMVQTKKNNIFREWWLMSILFVQGDCISLFRGGGAGVWCRRKWKTGRHLGWRLDRAGSEGVFGTSWAWERLERLRGCLCLSSIQQHVDWLSFVWCFQVFLRGTLTIFDQSSFQVACGLATWWKPARIWSA